MFTDQEFEREKAKYEINTPMTKAVLYFRQIFEELFPNCNTVDYYWIPNTKWEGVFYPSGRALDSA